MKRLLSLLVSGLILALIYWKIDVSSLMAVLNGCHRGWLVLSLAMVVPLVLGSSWRLQQLMPPQNRLGFGEANRLILASSVLNMILPSKMGDIAKAYFMGERGHLSKSLALVLVVFEKACDMLSLLLWCGFGLVLYPQKDWLFWLMTVGVGAGVGVGLLVLGSRGGARRFFRLGRAIAPKKMGRQLKTLQDAWDEMQQYFWREGYQLAKIGATSIGLWFLHLLQIWFFILALNAGTPFLANLALSPLALLAGLLPLTFAGVGTRDAALIFFYQPYFSAPVAAALGVLCTARYVLPAVGGLPFLHQYLVNASQLKGQNRGEKFL